MERIRLSNTGVLAAHRRPQGYERAGSDGRRYDSRRSRCAQRGAHCPRAGQELQAAAGRQGGQSPGQPRRGRGAARAQRRRQDDRVLHDHGTDWPPTRAPSRSTGRISPACRCISGRGSGSGICPRRARFSGGLRLRTIFAPSSSSTERDRGERERQLRGLLDEFAISHLRNSPAVVLSGGERRRVEIARALAANPEFHAARRAVCRD